MAVKKQTLPQKWRVLMGFKKESEEVIPHYTSWLKTYKIGLEILARLMIASNIKR